MSASTLHGVRVLLLFCLVLACVRPPPATPPPPRLPPPPPSPVAAPAPEPPPPPPVVITRPAPLPVGPVRIRVGLATDLERVDLPCCDGAAALIAGETTFPLTTATAVTPADVLVRAPVFRLQVAALKDERQALGIADYLRRATGEPADAVFDADTDLYKVRYGRFTNRDDATPHRERLAGLGLAQAWITSEGGAIENPGFVILRDGRRHFAAGRWLEVEAPESVAVQGGRYRGRVLLYLNDRGRLNLINDLELEDYLRGVVPKEMGPELYDQLEALKAQTVAARTYAMRNLGEFSNEGYDICSTPRCQVYGGMRVEHRLSDRAIAETAGEVVLFHGEPAETFYGATCGGHTENVEVVFPLKRGEYLQGVPCMEAGPRRIGGDAAAGAAFPRALTERLLPPSPGTAELALGARLEHLALLAGLSVPRDRLASLERREVARFVASVFDLALDPRMFTAGIEPLVADPPRDWRPRDLRFASYVAQSGLLADPPEQRLDDGEAETLLFRLALYLGVLRREDGHFLEIDDGGLAVRTAEGRESWRLPARLVTFRRRGETLATGPLEITAGDRLELYWHRHQLVGLVQPVAARVVPLGRHAPRQRWSRFVSESELRRAVQTRYPGFPFTDFEVLARGVSGRVGKMRLLGSDGRTLLVEGLAVRWTLDVPDTLFEARRSNGGWQFKGRGWGHGVGMCQAGAFGMARRHLGYREILQHYYSGVELGEVGLVAPGPRNVLGP